jgi:hypothetical protein
VLLLSDPITFGAYGITLDIYPPTAKAYTSMRTHQW